MTAAGAPLGLAGGWTVELTVALLAPVSSRSSLLHLATATSGGDDIQLFFHAPCTNTSGLVVCTQKLSLELWQDGVAAVATVVPAVSLVTSYHVVVSIASAVDVVGGLVTVFINGALTRTAAVSLYPRSVVRTQAYIGQSANSSAAVQFTSLELNLLRLYDYSVQVAQANCLYSLALLNNINRTQYPSTTPAAACSGFATGIGAGSRGVDYSLSFPAPASSAPFAWYAGDDAHTGLAVFEGSSTHGLNLFNFTAEGSSFPTTPTPGSSTIEFWVNFPDETVGSVLALWEQGNVAGGQLLSLAVDLSLPPSFLLRVGQALYTAPAPALNTSAWQHIALRLDTPHPLLSNSSTFALFLNGLQTWSSASLPAPSPRLPPRGADGSVPGRAGRPSGGGGRLLRLLRPGSGQPLSRPSLPPHPPPCVRSALRRRPLPPARVRTGVHPLTSLDLAGR